MRLLFVVLLFYPFQAWSQNLRTESLSDKPLNKPFEFRSCFLKDSEDKGPSKISLREDEDLVIALRRLQEDHRPFRFHLEEALLTPKGGYFSGRKLEEGSEPSRLSCFNFRFEEIEAPQFSTGEATCDSDRFSWFRQTLDSTASNPFDFDTTRMDRTYRISVQTKKNEDYRSLFDALDDNRSDDIIRSLRQASQLAEFEQAISNSQTLSPEQKMVGGFFKKLALAVDDRVNTPTETRRDALFRQNQDFNAGLNSILEGRGDRDFQPILSFEGENPDQKYALTTGFIYHPASDSILGKVGTKYDVLLRVTEPLENDGRERSTYCRFGLNLSDNLRPSFLDDVGFRVTVDDSQGDCNVGGMIGGAFRFGPSRRR